MVKVTKKKRKQGLISGEPISEDIYEGAEGPVAAKKTASDYDKTGSVKMASITGLGSPEQDLIPYDPERLEKSRIPISQKKKK